MKKIFIILALLVLVSSCKKDDEKVIALSNDTRYTFSIEFKGFWGADTHPTDYPADAKFSDILLVSHSGSNVLFSEGSKVASWFRDYVKTQNTESFNTFFKESKENGRIEDFVVQAGCGANASTEFEFTATGEHDRVSLISKLSPSPDWFVGINSLDLNFFEASSSATYILPIYDAGVFSGKTYTEQGEETSESVSYKKDAPVVYPGGGVGKFAIVVISRKKIEKIE